MGSIEEEALLEPEQGSGPRPPVNPLTILLYAVGRSTGTIIVLTILGLVIATAVAFSQPNFYRSVGMLLVRIGARELQTPESVMDAGNGTPRGGTATGDELIMLMDPSLQLRVVEEIGAERIMRPYDPAAEDNESTPFHIRKVHELQSWLMGFRADPSVGTAELASHELIAAAVETIDSGVEISPQRRSNTIMVSYTATDRELSQLVASTYLRVLQERHREFYENSNTHTFVVERLKEAKATADAARNALLAQRQKDGVYDLEARKEALAAEIQDLTRKDNQNQVDLESLSRQLTVLEEQLAETPAEFDWSSDDREESNGMLPDALTTGRGEQYPTDQPRLQPGLLPGQASYTLSGLRTILRENEEEMARLNQEYAITSPYYQQRSQELLAHREELKKQIEAIRRIPAPITPIRTPTGPIIQPLARQMNPVHNLLLSRRFETSRELQALGVSSAADAKVLASHREKLKELVLLEPIYASLEREVVETENRASGLERAHTRSATLKLIDSQENMGNLLVTQEPFLPREKEGPKRAKILLMGLFGGLAAGMAVALARQLLDSRLREQEETESLLGIRVLGVIPEQRAWRRTGKQLQKTNLRS